MNYPVDLEIAYPERSSRGWAAALLFSFTWIKLVALVPHAICLFVLDVVQAIVFVVAQFAVLFTGSYPEGMFDFVAGVLSWRLRVFAFFLGLCDEYPPFSVDTDETYPLRLHVERPAQSSRIWAFNTITGGITLGIFFLSAGVSPGSFNVRAWFLAPHLIVLGLLSVAGLIVFLIAPWAVLFSGRFPRSMHDFLSGLLRWDARLNGFMFGLCEKYPPFSLDANDAPTLSAADQAAALSGGLAFLPPPPPPPPPGPHFGTPAPLPPPESNAGAERPAVPETYRSTDLPPGFKDDHGSVAVPPFAPESPAVPPDWRGWDDSETDADEAVMPDEPGEWGYAGGEDEPDHS